MGRFRTAIGEAGVEDCSRAPSTPPSLRPAEFERIIVDSTVQVLRPLFVSLLAAFLRTNPLQ